MIGIFDSGIGGLSVYREIRKILPGQKYVYFADNAHCPYGEKSPEYITDRCRTITDFLIGKGAEIIVVACNTATAAAIAELRASYPIPFIGMEPAVKPAALQTKSGVIGVLATAGTLKGSKYLHTRDNFSGDTKVVEHVGAGFVELVESGQLSGIHTEDVVYQSVEPLISQGADIIVLGCTHYPFLSETIFKIATGLAPDRDIRIIDPAPAVARQVASVMRQNNIPEYDSSDKPDMELYASGNDSLLKKFFKSL